MIRLQHVFISNMQSLCEAFFEFHTLNTFWHILCVSLQCCRGPFDHMFSYQMKRNQIFLDLFYDSSCRTNFLLCLNNVSEHVVTSHICSADCMFIKEINVPQSIEESPGCNSECQGFSICRKYIVWTFKYDCACMMMEIHNISRFAFKSRSGHI